MTPEGTARYIDLIFNMVAKTVITEEHSSEYEFQNALFLYMGIIHNFHDLVDT